MFKCPGKSKLKEKGVLSLGTQFTMPGKAEWMDPEVPDISAASKQGWWQPVLDLLSPFYSVLGVGGLIPHLTR